MCDIFRTAAFIPYVKYSKQLSHRGYIPVDASIQGSKVFNRSVEGGGPFVLKGALIDFDPRGVRGLYVAKCSGHY